MNRYSLSQAVAMLDDGEDTSDKDEDPVEYSTHDNDSGTHFTVLVTDGDFVPDGYVEIHPQRDLKHSTGSDTDENNNIIETSETCKELDDLSGNKIICDSDSDSRNSDEESTLPTVVNDINSTEFSLENTVLAQASRSQAAYDDNTLQTSENKTAEDEIVLQRGRKRSRNESEWKENVRKRLRQSGKEYVNVHGKFMRAREVTNKKDCQGKCKYKCGVLFSQSERQLIFDEFWNLTDSEKNSFYGNTTDKLVKERQRTVNVNSRRNSTYKYYLKKGLDRVRVCKDFYLSTLDISAKRVEYYYKKSANGQGFSDKRGTPRMPKISKEAKAYIQQHINSFPRVPSHYCRGSSSKEYLDPDLNVSEMYRLYQDKCEADNIIPQTRNAYYTIFRKNFNLSFLKPKKDRCDICEEYSMQKEHVPLMQTKYEDHIRDKCLTKDERRKDRESNEENEIIICFDMENVLTCPRSHVSNFFYKRKLNVFNMTGHCNIDKIAYNIIWNQKTAGRGSGEIASAVSVILDQVFQKYPETTRFILWSDSCVPQNRNSIMCYALKLFQQRHPQVLEIIQKFGSPGHSSIQEIDNVHSHIEKKLRVSDIYSPLSLIRKLKQVRPNYMVIIQMKESSFIDFNSTAALFCFKQIPFSKVKALKYVSGLPFNVFFKTSFDTDYSEVTIRRKTRSSEKYESLPLAKQTKSKPTLSAEKIRDIQSMLKFMPDADREFMENICQT